MKSDLCKNKTTRKKYSTRREWVPIDMSCRVCQLTEMGMNSEEVEEVHGDDSSRRNKNRVQRLGITATLRSDVVPVASWDRVTNVDRLCPEWAYSTTSLQNEHAIQ